MDYCPLENVIKMLSGKWKLLLLWHINEAGAIRFNALQRQVTGISTNMLSQSLRDLERDELVVRRVYEEALPRVEYALTEDGRTVMEVLKQLRSLGDKAQQRAEQGR